MSSAPPGGGGSREDAGASIARNTAFALLAQLSTSVLTAALTLFLVRALDPAGFGVFALALSIGTLLLVPSDFGITQATARFIAERRGDRDAVADLFAAALRLKLLASAVVSVALALAAPLIADAYAQPDLVWPLRAISIAVFAQSVMLFCNGMFTAQRRVPATLRIVASESMVEVGMSIVLVLLGGGASGAVFGRAIGYGFGAALAVVVTVRYLGRRALALRSARGERGVGRYAGALLVVDGAYTAFGALDTLIIAAFVGPAPLGVYKAPTRILPFLHYPGLALASGVAPRLARSDRNEPNVGAFVSALRGLILLQGALIAPLLVWATPIVDLLFGDGYEEASDVLRAFAPYVFLSGLAPLVSVSVNYLGGARMRIPIAVGALVLNAVLLLTLVPRWGIVGGAVAMSISYGLYVPGHLWVCHRMLGLPLRDLGVTLVRALVAATAAALVLLALGPDDPTLVRWVAAVVSAPLVYAAVLVALRETTVGEVRELGRAAGARVAGRRGR